jgi:hypothetical protein
MSKAQNCAFVIVPVRGAVDSDVRQQVLGDKTDPSGLGT